MKRKFWMVFTLLAVLVLGGVASAHAQTGPSRIRVFHASPDAPNVDVLVNDELAFENVAFRQVTDYSMVEPGSYNIKVVPTGAAEPVVIDVNVDLATGTFYTIVAADILANITPLVVVDDVTRPNPGQARIRVVHAAPDAPAVDVAVTNGNVLFSGLEFTGISEYLTVEVGTYNLEIRQAGTDVVVLALPGVALDSGSVQTVYATGLLNGAPAFDVTVLTELQRLPVSTPPIARQPVFAKKPCYQPCYNYQPCHQPCYGYSGGYYQPQPYYTGHYYPPQRKPYYYGGYVHKPYYGYYYNNYQYAGHYPRSTCGSGYCYK